MATAYLTLKTCSVCKNAKPLSEFHRNKRAADGLCYRCKPCNCAHVQKAREADPERTKLRKSADYLKHRDKRLQQVKAHRAANIETYALKAKARYKRDKEKVAAAQHAYYLKNAECIKQRSAEWTNGNRARRKEIGREWRQRNKATVNFWDANRRAAEKQATPSWANSFFIAEAYDLAKLREKVCGGKWHVDHIVPLQSKKVCGLHVEHNLQVIPGGENLRKSNRLWPDMP